MSPKVAILLSTYNGEKFLPAQFESILAQSHENFIIVVRDDNSSDSTRELLDSLQAKNPDTVHLLAADDLNLGASAGFSRLIAYTLDNKKALGLEPAYLMFCDQDDWWHTNKIELELALLRGIEAKQARNVPVLVHSDLKVVSENGELIADSFINFQGLNPARNKFAQVLVSNKVTGCTALINEALARKSLPVSDQAIMHDWWLGLVASAFGTIGFVAQQLIDYRQHSSNTIGAKRYSENKTLSRIRLRKAFDNNPVSLHHDVASQAAAFLHRYQHDLSLVQKAQLRMAMALKSESGILQRILFRLLR